MRWGLNIVEVLSCMELSGEKTRALSSSVSIRKSHHTILGRGETSKENTNNAT